MKCVQMDEMDDDDEPIDLVIDYEHSEEWYKQRIKLIEFRRRWQIFQRKLCWRAWLKAAWLQTWNRSYVNLWEMR